MGDVTVAIPAYNESSTLGRLLDVLQGELDVAEILVVDDCSSDGTDRIARAAGGKVRLIRHEHRSGQTVGWQTAIRAATYPIVVFVDADSVPQRDAINELARNIRNGFDLAGGRAEPHGRGTWPPSRFSARVFSTLSEMGYRETQVIGRLFAIRRSWLADVDLPKDVISNDLWLAMYAEQTNARFVYSPRAVVSYAAPGNIRDFKAQRLRAGLGRIQLQRWGLVTQKAKTRWSSVLSAVALSFARDPFAGACWAAIQIIIHISPIPRVPLPADGMWQQQSSTKTL
ncbi:MAG TPA: glycosyltransferase [Candidatus Baltobacteraceae bacterium]|nr:glycosyltransferase [Candidatus Baltobacteraceae bacterium]